MPTHNTDPIIAAIARHRKASAALLAACDHKAALEEKLGAGGFYDGTDPEWLAAKKAEAAAYRTRERAALRLLAIQPTTCAGVAALLVHFAQTARCDDYFVSAKAEQKLGAPYAVLIATNAATALMEVYPEAPR
jgi:hypothetical protein